MATTEQLQTQLSQAEDALHALITGKQTVRLEYDGKSVTYTAAKMEDLRGYILELQVKLKIRPSRSRASRVWF